MPSDIWRGTKRPVYAGSAHYNPFEYAVIAVPERTLMHAKHLLSNTIKSIPRQQSRACKMIAAASNRP